MKKVYIIHGWEGSPEEPMLKWLKKELKSKGFEAIVPIMPNSSEPEIEAWVNKLNEIVSNPDENNYFIGHSIGCQGILRYLERLNEDVKIGGVVFIAPWMHLDENTIKEEGEKIKAIAKPWMEIPIDWDKVKLHTNKFVCILSDNDPYVPLTNKELFEDKLNAKIILEHEKGHYAPDDDIKENSTALGELLKIAKD